MKLADAIVSDIFDHLYSYDELSKALDSMSPAQHKEMFNDTRSKVNDRLTQAGAVVLKPATLIDF